MILHFEHGEGRKHAQGFRGVLGDSKNLPCFILDYQWWLSPTPNDSHCIRGYADNKTPLAHIEGVFYRKVVLPRRTPHPLEVVSLGRQIDGVGSLAI